MNAAPHPRHPAYGTDAVITSTEAARILRTSPHDPLAFHRLDGLRATGKLKPIWVGDDQLGARFLRSDVERLARPWEHVDELEPVDDVFEPARGVEIALIASAVVVVGLLALYVWGTW